jgi:flagellar protein FlaG
MSNDITAIDTRPTPQAQELAQLRPVKADPKQDPQVVKASRAAEEVVKRIDPETSRRELEKAVERLNEQIKKSSYNLNFSFDKASNHVVVKVRSASSGEVIRQIPNDTVLKLAEHLEDLKGLLQDEKI